jgi:hypothetical protein
LIKDVVIIPASFPKTCALPEIEGAGAANRSPEAMSDKSSFFADSLLLSQNWIERRLATCAR